MAFTGHPTTLSQEGYQGYQHVPTIFWEINSAISGPQGPHTGPLGLTAIKPMTEGPEGNQPKTGEPESLRVPHALYSNN
jgi:hypothetical protein